MALKRVAIVGTVGIPARYGGFETLAENLVLNKSEGITYDVFCSAPSYERQRATYGGAKLIYLRCSANGASSVLYDFLSLYKCYRDKYDVILILGVSGCLLLPAIKTFGKYKVVTNIDGMEWRRKKWGWWAKLFLKISERFAVKYSDIVVTDNQGISDYVKNSYGVLPKTISYGGDHAIVGCNAELNETRQGKYAFALCRIEPENNVHLVLEAFHSASYSLVFVGNWDASTYGMNLKSTYCGSCNIKLLDPIYDLKELFRYRSQCSLYVHGHSAGGTNPSLVEMMHFGKPILAFDCIYNRYTTEQKAAYFTSASDLSKFLVNYEGEGLEENAKAMEVLAKKYYTWARVTKEYESLF